MEVRYRGDYSLDDNHSGIEYYQAFSWEEFVSLGRKISIPVKLFYELG